MTAAADVSSSSPPIVRTAFRHGDRQTEIILGEGDRMSEVNLNDIATSSAKSSGSAEDRAIEKWRDILEAWSETIKKRPARLKRRIRRGVPQVYRGHVWKLLSGSETLSESGGGTDFYQKLLQKPSPVAKRIMHDVNRTFPKHHLFRDVQGIGQRSLFNVLRAYSIYDPSVNYCQGMGFVTGLFLCYMPEREAFWMLVAMMRRYDMGDVFKQPLTRVKLLLGVLERLVHVHLPDLADHFREIHLEPQTYATQWFMTVFLYSFPFAIAVRVWDIFLAEGWSFIVRVALAILKIGKRHMMKQDLEACMRTLKTLPLQIEAERLIGVALGIRVRADEIAAGAAGAGRGGKRGK
eukprot:g4046.t1